MSFGTQFHASHDEIEVFVREAMRSYGLSCVVKPNDADRMVFVGPDQEHEIRQFFSCVVLYFVTTPPPSKSYLPWQFDDEYDDVLALAIGTFSGTNLEQSYLSTRSNSATWKEINRSLKKITQAGASITGSNGDYVSYARFTKGAKTMFDNGIRMVITPANCIDLPEYREKPKQKR